MVLLICMANPPSSKSRRVVSTWQEREKFCLARLVKVAAIISKAVIFFSGARACPEVGGEDSFFLFFWKRAVRDDGLAELDKSVRFDIVYLLYITYISHALNTTLIFD